MSKAPTVEPQTSRLVTPLTLSDRMIALAKDADQAGFSFTAGVLVSLACAVFDETPKWPH